MTGRRYILPLRGRSRPDKPWLKNHLLEWFALDYKHSSKRNRKRRKSRKNFVIGCWDHFSFTEDRTYLSSTTWPVWFAWTRIFGILCGRRFTNPMLRYQPCYALAIVWTWAVGQTRNGKSSFSSKSGFSDQTILDLDEDHFMLRPVNSRTIFNSGPAYPTSQTLNCSVIAGTIGSNSTQGIRAYLHGSPTYESCTFILFILPLKPCWT